MADETGYDAAPPEPEAEGVDAPSEMAPAPMVRYTRAPGERSLSPKDVQALAGPDGSGAALDWNAENGYAVPLEDFKAALGSGWENALSSMGDEIVLDLQDGSDALEFDFEEKAEPSEKFKDLPRADDTER